MKMKNLLKQVRKMTEEVLPCISFPSVVFVPRRKDLYLKTNPLIVGYYRSSLQLVVINQDALDFLSRKKSIKILLHEVGHHVHASYFGYRAQYLPRKHGNDRSLYCNTDQKESFAECFADYTWAYYKGKHGKIATSKRLSKMEGILRKVSA